MFILLKWFIILMIFTFFAIYLVLCIIVRIIPYGKDWSESQINIHALFNIIQYPIQYKIQEDRVSSPIV